MREGAARREQEAMFQASLSTRSSRRRMSAYPEQTPPYATNRVFTPRDSRHSFDPSLQSLSEEKVLRGDPLSLSRSGRGQRSRARGMSGTLGSPVTRQILGRQQHTRHESIDVGSKMASFATAIPKSYGATQSLRSGDARRETPRRPENSETDANPSSAPSKLPSIPSDEQLNEKVSTSDDEYSDSSGWSTNTDDDLFDAQRRKLQNAKYVFLTLRTALLNSMVIIAVGCAGFWLIEGFSFVDSWYFTTVLLTTVRILSTFRHSSHYCS